MAITGSGTQADPWVVTTYAELVEKANDEGYIKIGNNINITDEYPDGDMPTLEIVKSDIDGDGKVISNWYKIDSGYCINETDSSDTVSCIHDLTIKNVYITSAMTAFCGKAEDNGQRPFFRNCNISGEFKKRFTDDNSATIRFKDCSFNCDMGNNRAFGFNGGYFDNCYVKMKSTLADSSFYEGFYLDTVGKDSYFELELPNVTTSLVGYNKGFENCVLDIASNSSFRVGGGSAAVSVLNSTHAPNVTVDGTNTKAVDDTHWLDVSYLSSIGFNAG